MQRVCEEIKDVQRVGLCRVFGLCSEYIHRDVKRASRAMHLVELCREYRDERAEM